MWIHSQMKLYGPLQYDLCLSKKAIVNEGLYDEIFLPRHEELLLFINLFKFLNYYLQKFLFKLQLIIQYINIGFHYGMLQMLESFIKIANLNEFIMLHHELQKIKLMFILCYIASSIISFFNCSSFKYLQEHSLELLARQPMIHDQFLKLFLDLQIVPKSKANQIQKQFNSIILNFKIKIDLSMLHFILSLN